MRKRKFKHGDIVALEGSMCDKWRDPNYGIRGRVVGYSNNPFEECPIVETFTPFKYGMEKISSVEHLADYWWILVDEPKECVCESLL